MSHARIQPSSAGVWVHCPGSITMQERYPERSDSGAEGTATHHAAALALTGQPWPALGSTAPNGVIFNEDMLAAAKIYVDAVCAVHPATALHVEERISCSAVHSICNGTPDVWAWDHDRSEIHVWDLKYGWGIVEAYENYQLITYASGVLDMLSEHYQQDMRQYVTVVLHIAQPRPWHALGPVREWRVAGSDLRPYVDQLRAAAVEAVGPDPRCVTGTHCHYCKARHACPAAVRAGYAAMEFTQRAVPEELTPEQMGVVWQQLTRAEESIKFLKSGLEGQLMAMLTTGQSVPGMTLEPQAGRRNWTAPLGEILALGELYGVDLAAPATAITPVQASRKLPAEVVNAYSSIESKGMKLVPTGKTFAAVFGGAPRVIR